MVVEFKDKFRAHQVCIKKFYDLSKVSTWKYLVENGADIHVNKEYAMRWAAAHGHFSVVKYLVKNRANIHALDDHALRWAICNGHRSVVEYLKGLK